MEGLVGIIAGFAGCLVIIITLIIVVCCGEKENNILIQENKRLRQTLEDYQRLEQASLEAHIALTCEAQKYYRG